MPAPRVLAGTPPKQRQALPQQADGLTRIIRQAFAAEQRQAADDGADVPAVSTFSMNAGGGQRVPSAMYGQSEGGYEDGGRQGWQGRDAARSRHKGPLNGELRLAEDALRRIDRLLDASKDTHSQELASAGGESNEWRERDEGRWRERERDGNSNGVEADRHKYADGEREVRRYHERDARDRRRFAGERESRGDAHGGSEDSDRQGLDADRQQDRGDGHEVSEQAGYVRLGDASHDEPRLPRATPSVIEWLKGALAVALAQQGSSSSLRATSHRLSEGS
jgi:hypothetical protein